MCPNIMIKFSKLSDGENVKLHLVYPCNGQRRNFSPVASSSNEIKIAQSNLNQFQVTILHKCKIHRFFSILNQLSDKCTHLPID